MLTRQIPVVYKKKFKFWILLILLMLVFSYYPLRDTLLDGNITIEDLIYVGSEIITLFFLVSVVLSTQKAITFSNKVTVHRVFLGDVEFKYKEIISIGSLNIKTPKVIIPISLIKNSNDIIEELVKRSDIINKEEALAALSKDVTIYKDEFMLEKAIKNSNKEAWIMLTIFILVLIGFIYRLFIENAPLIFLIGLVVMFAVSILRSRIFKDSDSKIYNAIMLIFDILITLVVTYIIYIVLMKFGIDLLTLSL